MARIPLVDGALIARLSYRQLLDRVTRGDVRGGREGRSWYVVEEDCHRLAAQRGQPVGA